MSFRQICGFACRGRSQMTWSQQRFSPFLFVSEKILRNSNKLHPILISHRFHFTLHHGSQKYPFIFLCFAPRLSSHLLFLPWMGFIFWFDHFFVINKHIYLFHHFCFVFFSWSCSLILSRDAILQINRNNFDCWFLYWNHSEYKSKRMPLRKKYKIERKCREYKRKLRREARKNPQKRKSW